MIKKYIIDGNNLIGQDQFLAKLQKSDPESSREKLAFKVDKHFYGKKSKVTLHFDGHPGNGINTSKIKIVYSYNRTADEEIKDEISLENTRKLIAVVSSDHNIQNFAKACSCSVIKSEQFLSQISRNNQDSDSEKKLISDIDNDEIKRLFGV